MGDAFVCDRCGHVGDGSPDTTLSSGGYDPDMKIDLCSDCRGGLEKWLRGS